MDKFELIKNFEPKGDQPLAIYKLVKGLEDNVKHQVLLGATGTGKTFTMANVIVAYNKPTLVLAHNKTLAMQLYVELKELFPNNRVEYFVSNFDFYQPEAYIPSRDLYIDKDAKRNQDLEMMRLSAMNALTIRNDVIVVASVAAIYATQNPEDYSKVFFEISTQKPMDKKELLTFLIRTGYVRNDVESEMGIFSVKGDIIKIFPGWTDKHYFRVSLFGNNIESIEIMEPLNNTVLQNLQNLTIYPAAAYVTDFDKMKTVVSNIETELESRVEELIANGQVIEADRLNKRTRYDMEMLTEFGICSGIENYSAHLDFRERGATPYSIIDYFGKDFLTIIDESHMMIPQIRGMFNADRSRKETLVNFGFRLPSALDNRPLNFKEFEQKLNKIIYTSATPGDYEMELTKNTFVEQIIRPTGLLDPTIEVRPTENQINDIINEIKIRVEKKEKVFITAITIRMSEDITNYLLTQNIKVTYLHSELKTLERNQVLVDLRKGVYDVVVGVNLLREGLDIPEVSLVCVLDADKQGFLRNTRSLIQIVGRAARNKNGHVIFYADKISDAMKEASDETNRRRDIQIEYNNKHNITPTTIIKKISDVFLNPTVMKKLESINKSKGKKKESIKYETIKDLRHQMLAAAKELNFEKAAELRDVILELESE